MTAAIGTDRVTDKVAEALRGGRADALLVGLLAFVLSVLGAGRPSFWLDEAATVAASKLSLSQMWDLMANVDGVHGLYYLFMHLWFSVFPATEFWARVPSALFVGGAAAGIVVLGATFSSRSVGLAAGVVFSVLPRTTWAGVEARSYALSMFDAVWLTLLCLVAIRSGRLALWAAYALALVVTALGNVFMLFVVAAHGVLVLALGRTRRTLLQFVGSVLAATVVIAPFLLLIDGQNGQVAWIPPVGPGTLGQILGDQYFPAVYSDNAPINTLENPEPFTSQDVSAAVQAWVMVLPVIVVLGVLAVAALRMRRRAGAPLGDNPRLLIWVGGVWVLVPTAVLVGYSAIGTPMYQPHYLAYTAPGLALLIGLAVVTVGRQPRRIAIILAVLVIAAVPNYLMQRGPYAKFGHDYSKVADLLAAQASPGECLNIDTTAPGPMIEGLVGADPEAFATLRDPGLERTGVERGLLFESRVPITSWADQVPGCPALWTITRRDESLPSHQQAGHLEPGPQLQALVAYRIPASRGFVLVERWQFNRTQVAKSVREPAR